MSDALESIAPGEFERRVLAADGPVLVAFGNKACAPCRAQEPILADMAGEFAGRVAILKLDTLENQDIARAFDVRNIPKLSLFRGGEEIDHKIGLHSRTDLRSFLTEHL